MQPTSSTPHFPACRYGYARTTHPTAAGSQLWRGESVVELFVDLVEYTLDENVEICSLTSQAAWTTFTMTLDKGWDVTQSAVVLSVVHGECLKRVAYSR